MSEVTLDKETLKAISSDIRLKILKTLEQKQQTQTDLASLLQLKIPTVKEHLNLLEKQGLVFKEEGRKWKYYKLTEKGKALVTPEDNTIKLLLFGTTALGVAAAFSLYNDFRPPPTERMATFAQDVALEAAKAAPIEQGLSVLSLLLLILTVILLLSLVYFSLKKK